MGNGDVQQGQAHVEFTFGRDDVTLFHKKNTLALRTVGGQGRCFGVIREKGHGAGAFGGHGDHQRIFGIENRHTRGVDIAHNNALQHRQIFDGGDVVQTQVVTAADIGHHRNLATVKRQAFAQHATTCGFKHSGIDIGVHQHAKRTLRSCTVAGIKLVAIGIDAIGIGNAHAQPTGGKQMRNQSNGGGFTVGTGYRHHRNSPVFSLREHLRNDGLAHIASFAKRGAEMHA